MNAIELENVYFSYVLSEDNIIKAVRGLSLQIEEGSFVAMVGHNGSGKSTIAKLLNGLLIPDYGKVKVFGMDTQDKDHIFDVRKSVGMVFQNPDNQMVASIIEDDIAFYDEANMFTALVIVQRQKKGFLDIAMQLASSYDNPNYF